MQVERRKWRTEQKEWLDEQLPKATGRSGPVALCTLTCSSGAAQAMYVLHMLGTVSSKAVLPRHLVSHFITFSAFSITFSVAGGAYGIRSDTSGVMFGFAAGKHSLRRRQPGEKPQKSGNRAQTSVNCLVEVTSWAEMTRLLLLRPGQDSFLTHQSERDSLLLMR